jgi:predicted alpha/beta hydrolase
MTYPITTINIKTQDGYAINGFEWRSIVKVSSDNFEVSNDNLKVSSDNLAISNDLAISTVGNKLRDVVIINPATSVRCRYYFRFAQYLFDQGFDVITYDYRGIGESKPNSLRGFKASWVTWGEQDFEAVLRNTQERFPNQKILIVGHSIGGVLIGLAPSNYLISRVFTMGSQQAYWPDYLTAHKFGMVIKWHGVMPFIAATMGYLPAKRLGWMEDTPKQVALNWARMGQHLIPSIVKSPHQQKILKLRFEQMKAPIMAFGVEDDPFGTPIALNRLLDLYVGSERHHVRIDPHAISHPPVGHFAFFNDRFKETLWPITLNWLKNGIVSEQLGLKIQKIPAYETAMR